MFGSVTHSICDFDGKDTDGHFSLKLFGNIRSLLNQNGIFYTQPVIRLYGPEGNQMLVS